MLDLSAFVTLNFTYKDDLKYVSSSDMTHAAVNQINTF